MYIVKYYVLQINAMHFDQIGLTDNICKILPNTNNYLLNEINSSNRKRRFVPDYNQANSVKKWHLLRLGT